MPNAASLTVKIDADTKGAESGLDRVDQKIRSTAGGIKTAFGTAAGFLGAQLVTNLVGSFGQVVSAGLDFGKQMANVNSIMQLSDAQIAQYGDQLLDLAQNPGITQMPDELAAGLYNVASSGFVGADAMHILGVSAVAATAGLTTTETSGRAVTSVLNAYGLEASDAQMVSDLLFQTVQDGVITFDELANNMGNVLPVASSLGIALTDVFSAYSQLTLQGILPSAAETDIASLMKTALNPTEDLTAAVQAQGFANAQTAIQTLGLGGYVKLLDDATKGTDKTLYDYLGTQEAVNAALAIGGKNIDDYNKEQEKMKHASDGVGATQAALAEQMKSASFQIAKAKQEAMILATTLVRYVSPAIAKFAGGVAKGIGSFTKWIDKALVGQIKFYKQLGRSNIEAVFSALGITLENLTGINLDTWFKRMGTAMQRPIDAARKLLSAISDGNWRKALSAIGDQFSNLPKLVGDAFKGISTGIKPLDKALRDLGTVFTDTGRLIQEVFQGDFSGAGDVLRRLVGNIGDLGGSIGTLGGMAVNAVISVAAQWGGIVWGAATDAASWIKENAGSIAATALDATVSFAAKWGGILWGGALDAATWIKSNALDIAATGIDATISFLAKWGSMAWGAASDAGSWIKTNIGALSADDIDAAISFAATWSGITYGTYSDASAWITANIGPLTSDVTVSINMKLDELQANDPTQQGKSLGQAAFAKFVTGFTDGFGPGGGGGGSDLGGGGVGTFLLLPVKAQMIASQFIAGFIEGIGTGAAQAIADGWTSIQPGIAAAWGTFKSDLAEIFHLDDIFGGSFSGTGGSDLSGLSSRSASGGLVDGITTWITGEISTLKGLVSGWKDDITSALKDIMPSTGDVDLKLPMITIDLGPVSDVVNEAIAGITALAKGLEDAWNKLTFWRDKTSDNGPAGGGSGGFDDGNPQPGQGSMPGVTPAEQKRSIVVSPPRQKMPELDTSAYELSVNKLPGLLAKGVAAAQVLASSGAAQIGAAIGTGLGTMVANAGALMGAFAVAVGQGMSNALAAASVYISAIVSATATGFGQIPGIVAAAVGPIPGIIAGALSGAAGTAYGYGVNIGASLAAGISSQIGAVAAAAQALADAASSAVAGRAKIASPSKVFMELGGHIGEGFALGIESKYGRAAGAGSGLAGASIPSGSVAGRSHGDTHYHVYITPDSDQFTSIAQDARTGGSFAKTLPRLLSQQGTG